MIYVAIGFAKGSLYQRPFLQPAILPKEHYRGHRFLIPGTGHVIRSSQTVIYYGPDESRQILSVKSTNLSPDAPQFHTMQPHHPMQMYSPNMRMKRSLPRPLI